MSRRFVHWSPLVGIHIGQRDSATLQHFRQVSQFHDRDVLGYKFSVNPIREAHSKRCAIGGWLRPREFRNNKFRFCTGLDRVRRHSASPTSSEDQAGANTRRRCIALANAKLNQIQIDCEKIRSWLTCSFHTLSVWSNGALGVATHLATSSKSPAMQAVKAASLTNSICSSRASTRASDGQPATHDCTGWPSLLRARGCAQVVDRFCP